MDAEVVKQKLQQLGWETTQTDLIRFYYTAYVTDKFWKKYVVRNSRLRYGNMYQALIGNLKLIEKFQRPFPDVEVRNADLFDEYRDYLLLAAGVYICYDSGKNKKPEVF